MEEYADRASNNLYSIWTHNNKVDHYVLSCETTDGEPLDTRIFSNEKRLIKGLIHGALKAIEEDGLDIHEAVAFAAMYAFDEFVGYPKSDGSRYYGYKTIYEPIMNWRGE